MAACDDPSDFDSPLTERVTAELGRFIDQHTAALVSLHPDLEMLAEAVRAAVLDGGKRIRPTFGYWGWRSVQPAGAAGELELVRAVASLELLQACALVHDDVMDCSDTRRGQPAAHVRFARLHQAHGWPGSAESFGNSGAILLGDLLLSWAEEMFTGAISLLPAERAAAAEREFDLMRTEVVAGQFLDVLAQTRGEFDPAEALRVIRFKTSKYTVQRPLLLGAAAAGGDPATLELLSGYGHALGEAYQLRDDLRGVFCDPAQTGKPAGDDLREGKRTLLVALAMQTADGRQGALLRAGVGNPELDQGQVEELRGVLRATGAPDRVEQRIAECAAEATARLSSGGQDGRGPLRPDAQDALLELAHTTAHRSF
ncbi:MAG: polyprenyl synthetase family protein [Jatrophihabitans sp.]